jgi:hypothetical protein
MDRILLWYRFEISRLTSLLKMYMSGTLVQSLDTSELHLLFPSTTSNDCLVPWTMVFFSSIRSRFRTSACWPSRSFIRNPATLSNIETDSPALTRIPESTFARALRHWYTERLLGSGQTLFFQQGEHLLEELLLQFATVQSVVNFKIVMPQKAR